MLLHTEANSLVQTVNFLWLQSTFCLPEFEEC